MSNQNFADLLKSARTDAGISQAKLARLIGVYQPMISMYERDVAMPCDSNLVEICQALGIDIDKAIAAVAVSTRQKHNRMRDELVTAKKHPGLCYCSRGKFSSAAALLKICSARKENGEKRCQRCKVLKTYGNDTDALMECNITIMGEKK